MNRPHRIFKIVMSVQFCTLAMFPLLKLNFQFGKTYSLQFLNIDFSKNQLKIQCLSSLPKEFSPIFVLSSGGGHFIHHGHILFNFQKCKKSDLTNNCQETSMGIAWGGRVFSCLRVRPLSSQLWTFFTLFFIFIVIIIINQRVRFSEANICTGPREQKFYLEHQQRWRSTWHSQSQ